MRWLVRGVGGHVGSGSKVSVLAEMVDNRISMMTVVSGCQMRRSVPIHHRLPNCPSALDRRRGGRVGETCVSCICDLCLVTCCFMM